jgi:hypothetical protein
MGGKERYIQSFGGKTNGRRPLRRLRHRWEVDIKMNFQIMEWHGMD